MSETEKDQEIDVSINDQLKIGLWDSLDNIITTIIIIISFYTLDIIRQIYEHAVLEFEQAVFNLLAAFFPGYGFMKLYLLVGFILLWPLIIFELVAFFFLIRAFYRKVLV